MPPTDHEQAPGQGLPQGTPTAEEKRRQEASSPKLVQFLGRCPHTESVFWAAYTSGCQVLPTCGSGTWQQRGLVYVVAKWSKRGLAKRLPNRWLRGMVKKRDYELSATNVNTTTMR